MPCSRAMIIAASAMASSAAGGLVEKGTDAGGVSRGTRAAAIVPRQLEYTGNKTPEHSVERSGDRHPSSEPNFRWRADRGIVAQVSVRSADVLASRHLILAVSWKMSYLALDLPG